MKEFCGTIRGYFVCCERVRGKGTPVILLQSQLLFQRSGLFWVSAREGQK